MPFLPPNQQHQSTEGLNREQKCADIIGTMLVPNRLAVSCAKILIYIFFSNIIYGSSFIKQHSETVMLQNTKILIAV